MSWCVQVHLKKNGRDSCRRRSLKINIAVGADRQCKSNTELNRDLETEKPIELWILENCDSFFIQIPF